MPQKKPENQAAANAIIDSDIDARRLTEEASAGATSISETLANLARRLVELRVNRRISAADAKLMLREAWFNLHLVEYAKVAGKVKDKVDARVEVERKALDGADLDSIDIIRKGDIKAREQELAASMTKKLEAK